MYNFVPIDLEGVDLEEREALLEHLFRILEAYARNEHLLSLIQSFETDKRMAHESLRYIN